MKPKAKKTNRRVARVTEGSGNAFSDLGLPNPEQELLKAQLTLQIYTILKDSSMTQVEIAKILGVRQPQVSLLMRNRAGNFSVGRLMEFLTSLRQDVEITVRPARKDMANSRWSPRNRSTCPFMGWIIYETLSRSNVRSPRVRNVGASHASSYDPAGSAQNARCSPVTAVTGLRKDTGSSSGLTL